MKSCFAIVMLLTSLALGQTKSPSPSGENIWVGGTDLRLGLAKETVISRLAEHYKLVKMPTDGDNWMVQAQDNSSLVFGQVSFEKGRLTLAVRNWTNGDEDSFAIIQALYGALEQMTRDSRHSCQVDTSTQRSPGWESGSVTFVCGASNGSVKRPVVTTRETFSGEYKGKSTDIQELLLYEND